MIPSFWIRKTYLIAILLLLQWSSGNAQPSISTYAEGLTAPLGIAIDEQGRLWVAEQGTGNGDSRIAIVTTDGQVHSFLEGLPSEVSSSGGVTGSNGVYFDEDGNLIVIQGGGTDALSASLLVIDPTGFTPGDPPLGPAAIDTAYDIGSFSLGNIGGETNPYSMTVGPGGDWYIVDAAANGVIKRTSSGDLEVFATFDDIVNSSGIGPPVVDMVPTGIVFSNDKFYVGSFTGLPFIDGLASVNELDLDGNVSIYWDSLTTVVDVGIDPADGDPVILQHAAFQASPPFLPNSGGIYKLRPGGSMDTLITKLNRPSAMRFAPNGDLYISMLVDGTILKIAGEATAAEPLELPPASLRSSNYPNPFSSDTRIEYELSQTGPVAITVSDILGRQVRRLRNAVEGAGVHTVDWDGRDDGGNLVSSGIYLYRIESEVGTITRQMVIER